MPSRGGAKGPERVLGLPRSLMASPAWRKGSFSWDKPMTAVTLSPQPTAGLHTALSSDE